MVKGTPGDDTLANVGGSMKIFGGGGHDTVIADPAHDHITLTGVTVAQLQAHASDFHLV
jgi:hypothetical protein